MHGLDTIKRLNASGPEAETPQQAAKRRKAHAAAKTASKKAQAAAGKTGWKNGRDRLNSPGYRKNG